MRILQINFQILIKINIHFSFTVYPVIIIITIMCDKQCLGPQQSDFAFCKKEKVSKTARATDVSQDPLYECILIILSDDARPL